MKITTRSLIQLALLIATAFLPQKNFAKNTLPHIAILIICSDDLPVYKHLQASWRSYMHSNPEHIDAYFIRADPSITNTCELHEDTLYTRGEESKRPGITNKTIYALEYLLSHDTNKKYDYIIRTNLSTFYIYDRLLQFLSKKSRKRFYAGPHLGELDFASGSGFIMSRDIAALATRYKHLLLGNILQYDDVLFGCFFRERSIPFHKYPIAVIQSIGQWQHMQQHLDKNIFQFRIHTSGNRMDEALIQKDLFSLFYN